MSADWKQGLETAFLIHTCIIYTYMFDAFDYFAMFTLLSSLVDNVPLTLLSRGILFQPIRLVIFWSCTEGRCQQEETTSVRETKLRRVDPLLSRALSRQPRRGLRIRLALYY
jgi:hypothetical protein